MKTIIFFRPLNFCTQNVTYWAVSLVGHGQTQNHIVTIGTYVEQIQILLKKSYLLTRQICVHVFFI